MSDRDLTLWVIYDHPKDFPDKYAMRRWHIVGDTYKHEENVELYDDLTALRNNLTKLGLTCIPRQEGDDEKILEVWYSSRFTPSLPR